jgi:hypothetical protein
MRQREQIPNQTDAKQAKSKQPNNALEPFTQVEVLNTANPDE